MTDIGWIDAALTNARPQAIAEGGVGGEQHGQTSFRRSMPNRRANTA